MALLHGQQSKGFSHDFLRWRAAIRYRRRRNQFVHLWSAVSLTESTDDSHPRQISRRKQACFADPHRRKASILPIDGRVFASTTFSAALTRDLRWHFHAWGDWKTVLLFHSGDPVLRLHDLMNQQIAIT